MKECESLKIIDFDDAESNLKDRGSDIEEEVPVSLVY